MNAESGEISSWIKAFLLGLLLFWLVQSFLFVLFIVDGKSMYSTLENEDKIIVSKVSSIERFDVVVFDPPHVDEYYIKRVIGLPGDDIEFKDDILYINGEIYIEEYVNRVPTLGQFTGDIKVKVPRGKYYVMGDNRLESLDSRYFGSVEEGAMLGEAVFRYYPFKSIGKIK
ncbi:signal peptidase I (plasmid) [Rossellomorea sp. AcN35-11]|nr:signal peptidase I [Rossellomorea aquimaris]WJV32147.1 signal peptidase I [Rossellomorea sp. AcN35-11]